MKRIISFVKGNWVLIAILAVGLFFRLYKPLEYYMYSHDQDLAGWIVRDIVFNKHLRLIGQETSSKGVFIGPLFYYLQIPFYLIAKMNPIGTLALPIGISLFAIFSYYFCFSKMFNKKTGLIAAFIYAVSYSFIWVDREVVPTMPVMLWSVWYFYGLWNIYKGNSKYYILLGILLGLVWHINMALAILAPLIFVVQFFSKKKINLKYIFLGLAALLITLSPFILFEVRHNFSQTRAIISSLTSNKDYVEGAGHGLAKLDRVFQLVYKNTSSLFIGNDGLLEYKIPLYVFTAIFIYLLLIKKIDWKLGLIMFLWQTLYIIFFTLNSLNVSEYYLNGMNIVWLTIIGVYISYLFDKKTVLGIIVISALFLANVYGFFTRPINKSGYVERSRIAKYIQEDALSHNYPCVAVSYIVSPGNDMGYRYLYWIEGLHVNQPKSGSPVYTIVYPHRLVDRMDMTFGALGLILPDYEKYNLDGVAKSCEGEDANITDPMFGFTN